MSCSSAAVVARAQERMRTVGVFLNILADNDPESRLRIAAFKKSLQELGWKEGSNVRIEERYAGGDSEHVRKYAREFGHARAGRHPYFRQRHG